MSKSSTSTGESDPVADLGLRVLDGAVDGDTLCIAGKKMCESKFWERLLTAQRMEAASKDSSASGMGVTWLTHEMTYWEKVPSTVKPLYLPLGQTEEEKVRE